jgi:hypothetical protein
MADLIVVLDGSRVVEVGTHDDLLARRGPYAELYGIQDAAYRQTNYMSRSSGARLETIDNRCYRLNVRSQAACRLPQNWDVQLRAPVNEVRHSCRNARANNPRYRFRACKVGLAVVGISSK